MSRGLRRSIPLLPAVALLALPSMAAGVGLPETYPRVIATTASAHGVRVTRFEVSTRAVDRKLRVKVRVAATALAGARALTITVAPCTGGRQSTSPVCPPYAAYRGTVRASAELTHSFLVPQPSRSRDAVRVTLTAAGERLRGIGNKTATGEILLNGGTWRFRQGTPWGIVATPPAGTTVDGVVFNSRTYAWSVTSAGDGRVITRIGYEGRPPARQYTKPIQAGIPRTYDRTPRIGTAFESRSTTKVLVYTADLGGQRLFTVRVPLPRWSKAG